MLHGLDVAQVCRALALDLDAVDGGGTRCGATDMEGPHRQLGTGFTDRLRGNHTDGFADVDLIATTQIAPVTARANSIQGCTGDRRADHNGVDLVLLQLIHPLLIQQRTGRRNHFFFASRLDDVLDQDSAQHPLAQRFDDVAAFDQRCHYQTGLGATIFLCDDQVLRNIDQAPRQVTRVRGFQRGVGQALARAVSGDKVLQDIQAFPEIRGNRRLDNRAVRFRHQSTHAGQLPDLCRRTTGARISHHINRVKGFLVDLLAFGVDHLFAA